MPVKNTFKILVGNFSNVWKILLYKFVILLFAAGLVVGLVLPNVLTVVDGIAQTGLFENSKTVLNSFLTRSEEFAASIESVKQSVEQSSAVFAMYADKLVITYVFLAVIWLVVSVLSGLSQLAVADIIQADMSSGAKFGFMSRFIINFAKSFRYRLVYLITQTPCKIITAFAVWYAFSFMFSAVGVFALFFAVFVYILLTSFTQAFFCCWLPQIVVKQTPVFDSLRLGFNTINKKLPALMSSFILINICLIALHTILALFTCGVGLIISIPASSLFLVIYRMVIYYQADGQKYYTDGQTVVEPTVK